MLGLPVWLGAAIACVLIAAAAYFGLGGMVSVFTVAVPCMIVAALVIAGIRLHRAGLDVVMTDLEKPTAIRRTVCFSQALVLGAATVEDVTARAAASAAQAE